jgi:hypothetical protein
MQRGNENMGIHVGDDNKIKNSNFIEGSCSDPKTKSSFWSTVLVNLTSNFIWWIIGLIATGGLISVIGTFGSRMYSFFK